MRIVTARAWIEVAPTPSSDTRRSHSAFATARVSRTSYSLPSANISSARASTAGSASARRRKVCRCANCPCLSAAIAGGCRLPSRSRFGYPAPCTPQTAYPGRAAFLHCQNWPSRMRHAWHRWRPVRVCCSSGCGGGGRRGFFEERCFRRSTMSLQRAIRPAMSRRSASRHSISLAASRVRASMLAGEASSRSSDASWSSSWKRR